MSRVLCVGHAVQDYVFRLPELPHTAEKHRAKEFTCIGGGPAATAAVAIARLGGEASLAARIGDDAVGETIAAELRGYGVDCRYMQRFPNRRSSLSSVFVDDAGERLIVNYADPDMPTDVAWLEELPLENVGAVLADTRWPQGAQAILQRALRRGIPAVLDADVPVPKSAEFLSAATHVAFSLPGLCGYFGRERMELAEALAALQRLAQQLQRWCCVTLGAHGVAFTRGENPTISPAFAVEPVDTLGAGDVWHGAFALALAEARAEPEAVRLASAAAALKVTRSGGRIGAPTRAERDEFMQRYP